MYYNQNPKVTMSHQYIYGADGEPAFVVIPYAEYLRNNGSGSAEGQEIATSSLLTADGLFVRLPYGGPGAAIDLVQFIDAWMQRGTISMLAISKRRQGYDRFKGEAVNGLDAILRRCFLPKDSPYRNVMQATTAVVDALVETGVFAYSVEAMPGYYRPVQCIRIDREKAKEFLQKNGPAKNPLCVHEFILPV